MHELGLEVYHSSAADRQTTWPLFAVFAYSRMQPARARALAFESDCPTRSRIKVIAWLDKETTVLKAKDSEAAAHHVEAGKDASGVRFVFQFLSNIERTAASRGAYTLGGWLS